MSTGALILGVVSLVTIGDVLIGLYFLRMAAPEVGAPPKPDATPPEAARNVGRMLLISAPLIWLVVAAICFGIIPTGIDPIVLGGAG